MKEHGSSLYSGRLTAQVGWLGLMVGDQLVLSLHSSNERGGFGHDDNTINIIKVIAVIVIIIECSLPYSNSALATASLFARLSSVSVPRPRRRSSCKQHNAIYFHCSAITLTAMSALHMYRIHNLQVTSHLRLKMGRCANEKVTCIVTNGQNSSTLGHCRLSATMNEVTAVSILLCSQG